MGLTSELLLSLPEDFHLATQAPFLKAAGLGKLDKNILEQWLTQDQYYAQTYVRLIGLILSKVHLHQDANLIGDECFEMRVVKMLNEALANIVRELGFFEETAKKYGLDISSELAKPETKAYMDFMITTGNASLMEGLILLWGTGKCYFEAWSYAAGFTETVSDASTDADHGALRREFIPNWTSNEFRAFVEDLESTVNEIGKKCNEGEKQKAFEVWKHLLWLETKFWPSLH